MMNGKECGRKRLWRSLSHRLGIYLKGLRKITEHQMNQCPERVLKGAPPEYKLPLQPTL